MCFPSQRHTTRRLTQASQQYSYQDSMSRKASQADRHRHLITGCCQLTLEESVFILECTPIGYGVESKSDFFNMNQCLLTLREQEHSPTKYDRTTPSLSESPLLTVGS